MYDQHTDKAAQSVVLISFPCAVCASFAALRQPVAVHNNHAASHKALGQTHCRCSRAADPRVASGHRSSFAFHRQVPYARDADKLSRPLPTPSCYHRGRLALIGRTTLFTPRSKPNGTLDTYGRLTETWCWWDVATPIFPAASCPTHPYRAQRPSHSRARAAGGHWPKRAEVWDGDIVADDSYFAFERYGEGWTQDDLVWADGAPVSALTINDNVIFVNILPADRAGDRAFVSIAPFADYYRIDNRIMTTPAGTGRKIFINREPGATTLTLWGNMPLGDTGANEALAIEDPAEFAAELFRHLLEVRGIAVYGKQKTRHTELSSLSTLTITASAAARGGDEPSRALQNQPLVLASYQSRPLIEDVRVINKVSQNLHAEILLRLLGREKGTAGTIEGGLEVLRDSQPGRHHGRSIRVLRWLRTLAAKSVTPHAVVQMLRWRRVAVLGASRDTLPLSGTDGSLSNRFKNVDMQGRVQAKTGRSAESRRCPYATTNRGERVAFPSCRTTSRTNASTKPPTTSLMN